MRKRHFLVNFFRSLLLGIFGGNFLVQPLAANTNVLKNTFKLKNVDDVLMTLFDTTIAGEDGSIRIETPQELENSAYVPVRLFTPGAEKIALIIQPATNPLVLAIDPGENFSGMMMTTLQFRQDSEISCYVFRQGQLHKSSRNVELSTRGYEK